MSHGDKIYCFRQSFILFTTCIQSLSNGVMLAFPSVLNPAILDPGSDIRATPGQAGWLASVLGISGILGFLTFSPLMEIYGRKSIHIAKSLTQAISWIIFYYAESLTGLFVARIVQGMSFGGLFFTLILIGEYSSPDQRGYFTTIQKFAVSTGTLMCHVSAIWFDWRQIAGATIALPLLTICLTFFWKESPFFLAMRGRFDECEESFHWLNGTISRNAELQELINNQKKRREDKKIQKRNRWKIIIEQLSRSDFQRSFTIVAIVTIAMDLSGRNYFKAYVIQIMMELTGSKSTAVYISVGSDLLVLTALALSCFAIKYFRRRLLLFSFGSVTVISLFSISLILYLKSHGILMVWSWLSPSLFLFVNFIVHVGVSPICFVIMGEIYPLDIKGLGCCLSGLVFTFSYGVVLKLTPVLMEYVGLEGTYVVYASGLLICFTTLYYILPETKDKPLLDIEKNLKGVEQAGTDVLLKPDTF